MVFNFKEVGLKCSDRCQGESSQFKVAPVSAAVSSNQTLSRGRGWVVAIFQNHLKNRWLNEDFNTNVFVTGGAGVVVVGPAVTI